MTAPYTVVKKVIERENYQDADADHYHRKICCLRSCSHHLLRDSQLLPALRDIISNCDSLRSAGFGRAKVYLADRDSTARSIGGGVLSCVRAPGRDSVGMFAVRKHCSWEGRGGEPECVGCTGGICGDKEHRALPEEHRLLFGG